MTIESLFTKLNISVREEILTEALTHSSYANEKRSSQDNQRLEFLGDAVLGLCTSEILMTSFPDANEGKLSLMRSTLVNADSLAKWAKNNDLGTNLRLGRGADAAGERDQKNVLADAVEAVVGAVYIDCGLEKAKTLVHALIEEPLQEILSGLFQLLDSKSDLQERVQAIGKPSPRYRVIETKGPDHAREFVVVAESDSLILGTGAGRSKKSAEQAAAYDALQHLHEKFDIVEEPSS